MQRLSVHFQVASPSSSCSSYGGSTPGLPSDGHPINLFNIVSRQSSARPGCIIDLGPINDSAEVCTD